MPKLIKLVLWFSVFFLAFELPFVALAGQGIKLWMLSALTVGSILLWKIYQKGWRILLGSKIFLLGMGFIAFSAIGLINSPQRIYSLKQIAVLAVLITLGVFFELHLAKQKKIVYSALASGIVLSGVAAIYQNVAFNFGWPHFEVMSARPNAFFPEADWLGMYLALGLAPFLVFVPRRNISGYIPTKEGKASPYKEKVLSWRVRDVLLYLFLLLSITALILTVARASWLALIAEMGVVVILCFYQVSRRNEALPRSGHGILPRRQAGATPLQTSIYFVFLILASLILIDIFHLSRFNIPDRFRSIFFREHIVTIAQNPATEENFKINLEEIEKYRAQGYLIKENYITDENVISREEKFTSAWGTIKSHPILGSGLGITLINTNYQHNANNLFLEWWASAGFGGLALIAGLLIYLLAKGFLLIGSHPRSAMMILAGTAGFIIANLFNASIFLAFAWFYLAWLLAIAKHKTCNL